MVAKMFVQIEGILKKASLIIMTVVPTCSPVDSVGERNRERGRWYDAKCPYSDNSQLYPGTSSGDTSEKKMRRVLSIERNASLNLDNACCVSAYPKAFPWKCDKQNGPGCSPYECSCEKRRVALMKFTQMNPSLQSQKGKTITSWTPPYFLQAFLPQAMIRRTFSFHFFSSLSSTSFSIDTSSSSALCTSSRQHSVVAEVINPEEISFLEGEESSCSENAPESFSGGNPEKIENSSSLDNNTFPHSFNGASSRYNSTNGSSFSSATSVPPGILAASSRNLPSSFKEMKKMDPYSRGRVVSFIKRYNKGDELKSSEDLFETITIHLQDTQGMSKVGRFGHSISDEDRTLYHCRVLVPLHHPQWENSKIEGGLWAHGVASDRKSAETLAAMHAEYIINDLGYHIYSLPSMQRKHAAAARKDGRYAPSPDDEEEGCSGTSFVGVRATPHIPTLASFPLPLRRVVNRDESENGEWQLVEVRSTSFMSPQYAILSPCVVDKMAEERIRTFFRERKLNFTSHCLVEKEEAMEKGGTDFFNVSITFPNDILYTKNGSHEELCSVEQKQTAEDKKNNQTIPLSPDFSNAPPLVARGKASTVELAITLACMHAELTLDSLYIPLFPQDDFKQKSHAMSAWSFGRPAPSPGAVPKNPSHILLPLPLKELVISPNGTRYSSPNHEEDLVRKQRFLTDQVTEFMQTTVNERTAVEDLKFFLRRMNDPRYDHPFFTEQIQHHYKSTVLLPIDSSFGICGGVGVASCKRDADILAAMHALDLLMHLDIPVKPTPEEQESWVSLRRQRLGEAAPPILQRKEDRPPGRRLSPKGFMRSIVVDVEENMEEPAENKEEREQEEQQKKVMYEKGMKKGEKAAQSILPEEYSFSSHENEGKKGDTDTSRTTTNFYESTAKDSNAETFSQSSSESREETAQVTGENTSRKHRVKRANLKDEAMACDEGSSTTTTGVQSEGSSKRGNEKGMLSSPQESQNNNEKETSPLPVMDNAVSLVEKEKTLLREQCESISPDLWRLEADSPDGYIMVAPTDSRTQLLTLEVAIRSPRQMNHSSKARIVEYLAQMGRRFEDVFHTQQCSEEESRSGNPLHECLGKLPVPARFGDRVAVGKAASAVDAEILASMHAELLLDTLGIAIFADPVKQMRHAKECAKSGRWAPRDHDSFQDPKTASPPPLRLEYVGSLHWERSRKAKRAQPRSVIPRRAVLSSSDREENYNMEDRIKKPSTSPEPDSPISAAVASMPVLNFQKYTNEDPNELNDIPDMGPDVVHTIVSEEEVDLVSKPRVQYYLRRKGKTINLEFKSMMGRGTLIHIASGVLPLPDGHSAGTQRKIEGIATTKRDAEVLAWVHAERTLDLLGIEIFDNLPGLQRYHAQRAQEAGRWAPPLPRIQEENSCASASDFAALELPSLRLSSFLKQLQKPVLVSDSLSDWIMYVTACDDYIKSKVMQTQNIFFDQERAPRTGDRLLDGLLDEVEGKPIEVESKRLLQLYCNAAETEYPATWPMRIAGPLSHRVSWVTIPVPGFPHIQAQGVGANKEAASRRAAMHALAILELVDGDYETYYQEAKERMLETQLSLDVPAPLLSRASDSLYSLPGGKKGKQRKAKQHVAIWDRTMEDFTPEGKDRLIHLYTVCLGLAAPRVEERIMVKDGRAIRSTLIEMVDEDGRKWTGRGQKGGSSENRQDAVEALFSNLSRNNPTMLELMELLRGNAFLDPEKIANVTLTSEQEAAMEQVIHEAGPIARNFRCEDDVYTLKNSSKAEDEDSEQWASKFYKTEEEQKALSLDLQKRHESKLADPVYVEQFAAKRSKLSISGFKKDIVDAIENSRVLVLCGTTGCGKTTQVPQFILDYYTEKGKGGNCGILVTQPRRISAVTIAQRVAAERREAIGDICGYSIRFDTKIGKCINFCTSGVLLRMLHTTPLLEGINILIIDEIHERDINSDFILVLLQGLIQKRRDLRVILMSATLQADLFSSYFGNAPVINVEGYVHPVQDLFLEDLVPFAEERQFMTPLLKEASMEYEKENGDYNGRRSSFYDSPLTISRTGSSSKYGVLEAVTEIDYVAIQFAIEQAERMVDLSQSSVLVFLPGWEEITRAKEILERNPQYHILCLHSSVGNEEQMQCFLPAENGKRKVILSTNIAESGVTIDDIAAVIDVGRAKEKSYVMKKPEGGNQFKQQGEDGGSGGGSYYQGTVSQLLTVYASRANCTQRRGRVGRTRPGVCIRLYTRQHFKQLHDFQTPEMLRTPLDTLCLHILSLQLGDPRDFLRDALEPPPAEYIEAAMNRLHELGATTENGSLTPLGMRLSLLPVEPSSGKMILMGAVLKCLDAALTVASVSQSDVFSSQREHREPVRLHRENFSKQSLSDAIASVNGYNFWVATRTGRDPAEVQQQLESHLLSVPQLLLVSRLKRQFFSIVRTSRFLGKKMKEMDERDFLGEEPEVFVDRSEYSVNALDVGLVKCIIATGLFPNIVMNRGKRLMRTKEEMFIAPSTDSVVHKARQQNIQQPFFVFTELTKSQESHRFTVRGLTAIPLWTMLLMGTASMPVTYRHDLSLGIVDGWIVFRAPFRVLELIRGFKDALNSSLSRKFVNPDDAQNNALLDRIRDVIKDLVNSSFCPNNLVEEEWQEKGIIIDPSSPLQNDKSSLMEKEGNYYHDSANDGKR